MVELVDTRDLKSLGFGHAGSIPAVRTIGDPPSVLARRLVPFDPVGIDVEPGRDVRADALLLHRPAHRVRAAPAPPPRTAPATTPQETSR